MAGNRCGLPAPLQRPPHNPRMPLSRRHRRDILVIVVVVLGHALTLWSLHKASQSKPLQVIVPARLLAEFVTPAPPAAAARQPPGLDRATAG